MKEQFPDSNFVIPSADSLSISKMSGGVINTDTCNAALKTRRILIESIQEISEGNPVYECDCWNHLRNVWLGGMSKQLTAFLNIYLKELLSKFDSRMRMSPSMESLFQAVDKFFSLCSIYPKRKGELFKIHLEYNHPDALLFHVECASGSRQDLLRLP